MTAVRHVPIKSGLYLANFLLQADCEKSSKKSTAKQVRKEYRM
jgi:hypothetical protein